MGLKDWFKNKASSLDKGKIKETAKNVVSRSWSGTKKAAPVAGAYVLGKASVAKDATKSFFFTGIGGKITGILIVFLFASMGFVSGYPLYVVAWMGGQIWGIFNLLAYQVPSLMPVPDFFFTSAAQFTKGSVGAILNAIFGMQIIKQSSIRGFIRSLLSVSFMWVWVSMVFVTVYTGYYPVIADGPSPIGLCGLHQTANDMIGADPISCDPYDLGLQTNRFADQLEDNEFIDLIFSPLLIKTDQGSYFESDRIDTNYLTNEDAGSTISNLGSTESTYSYYEGEIPVETQDIEISGKLTSKTLFIGGSSTGEQYINITLTPELDQTQCSCEDLTCKPLSDEVVDGFRSIISQREYNIDNANTWCSMPWTCNIPGAEKIEDNTFRVKSAVNQQIECIHDGLAINDSKLTSSKTGRKRYSGLGRQFYVDLGFAYDTSAIVTKQLLIIDRSVVESHENPITYLNLNNSVTESKSVTDGKVEFGIGIDKSEDYLVPNYVGDSIPNTVKLGISINNPGSSKGDLFNLKIILKVYPDNEYIQFVCDSPEFSNVEEKWSLDNPCSVGENTGHFKFNGNKDGYSEFVLESSRAIDFVNSDDSETFFLTMFVDEESLVGASYQGIYVRSDVAYTFERVLSTDFRVSPSKF